MPIYARTGGYGSRLWRLTRPLRHPGNHRYAWAIDRATRRALPASQRYPKMMFEGGLQLSLSGTEEAAA